MFYQISSIYLDEETQTWWMCLSLHATVTGFVEAPTVDCICRDSTMQ